MLFCKSGKVGRSSTLYINLSNIYVVGTHLMVTDLLLIYRVLVYSLSLVSEKTPALRRQRGPSCGVEVNK